jgi:hypothetical protein
MTKECPICFDLIVDINNLIKTECGHEFHSNCFLTNVAHNGFNCPCCRKQLAKIPDSDGDSEDSDSFISDDEDEIVSPSINHVLNKINEKNYSKLDLLKIILHNERILCCDSIDIIDNLEELCITLQDDLMCIFNEFETKQKDNELEEINLMFHEDSRI